MQRILGLLLLLLCAAACHERTPQQGERQTVKAERPAQRGANSAQRGANSHFPKRTTKALDAAHRQLNHATDQLETMSNETNEEVTASAFALQKRRAAIRHDLKQLEREHERAPEAQQADIRQRVIELHRDAEVLRLRIAESRHAFQNRAQTRLNEIANGIDHIHQRLEYTEPAMRTEYRETLAWLRTRHRELATDVANIQHIDADNVSEIRWETADQIVELSTKVQTLVHKMEQSIMAHQAQEG